MLKWAVILLTVILFAGVIGLNLLPSLAAAIAPVLFWCFVAVTVILFLLEVSIITPAG